VSVTGQFAPLLLQLTLADFIRGGYFATHLKRMRRLYARRQKAFTELCAAELGRWLKVDENDAGMQVLGRFLWPFDDQEVAAAALERGIDVQPISINFHQGPAEHGLLLGFAGLDERSTRAAVTALQTTFRELERRTDPEPHPI
jgi:GntR family transcriptional regulator/MocR family aminotransferase